MSDCCSAPAPAGPKAKRAAAGTLTCPACARPGKSVSAQTVKHQVKPEHLATASQEPWGFCRTPDCAVVYFNAAGVRLTVADVRQAVTAKGGDNPPLCYCFGFDTAAVRAEIRATGRSTVPGRIAAEMKADRCACEIRNPQGSCCLANVTAAVKRELAAHAARSRRS
jgi:hypothetical protein